MPFTPSEIKNKEFTRVKNGLEPTEVANYLEQLSNEIERLKEDKKQLEKVIEDRDSNIKSYKDVHQSVSDALIQAQKVGEETKQAATKEAEAVLSKAQVQAIEKARRLAFQTEDMKRQSKVFRSRFRMLVEAQLDLLKSEDWDYLLNYDLDAEQVTLEDIHHLHDNDLTPEERAMKQKQNQEISANQPSTSSSESVSQSNANNESSQSTSNN